MNIHGKAEEQREDNIRRNKQVLATMGFALPEPKKRRVVSGITTKGGINHPSDQLRITDLEINSALFTKIENSSHFAVLQSCTTQTKFFVRFPDALPRQIVFFVNYCHIHLIAIVLFSQVLGQTD